MENTQLVHINIPVEILERLDELRSRRRPLPSRAEILRECLEVGVRMAEKKEGREK